MKRCGNIETNPLSDPEAFIEYSAYIEYVYNNINDYKRNKDRNTLIVFGDMSADIMTHEKFQAIIKELYIRCRKLNISLVFIIPFFFCSERNQMKFYTFLNNEDLPQKTTTKNL